MPSCLRRGGGWKDFLGMGDNEEYLGNIGDLRPCHGACALDVERKISLVRDTIGILFRRYRRDMCGCHGVCVLDVGGFPGSADYEENISRILRNVLVQWCLCFGFGRENFAGTGNNEENTSRTCRKRACAMMPAFRMGGTISWVRGTITTISREYAGNVPVTWCPFCWT